MLSRQKYILLLIIILFWISSGKLYSQQNYVTDIARPGDGLSNILDRHSIPQTEFNKNKFKELNRKKFDKNGGLIKGETYSLPIITINNRKLKISKATGITEQSVINEILEYNIKVETREIKKDPKHILWIPLSFMQNGKANPETNPEQVKNKPDETNKETKQQKTKKPDTKKNKNEVLFGPKNENIVITDALLQNCVFYLVSGHGGPDPGAIGTKDGKELCEDEYSYDVILRLAKNLMSHSADVYVIIQDTSDGIRDDMYLRNSTGEVLLNGDSLSYSQTERLRSQTNLINELSNRYSENTNQYSLNIHLDSRTNQKRIDIFFYYQDVSKSSKSLANTIYETIKDKYDKNQPGRGYKGSVTTRNLFMLRNTVVPTVYIELGNIKNPMDQIRFIDKNNRQAIANWIADGIIKEISKNSNNKNN
jgi:N-acetylmuramoyl-L-alanine amidase